MQKSRAEFLGKFLEMSGGQCQKSGRRGEFALEWFGRELREIKKTLEVIIDVFLMKCACSTISKLHHWYHKPGRYQTLYSEIGEALPPSVEAA